MLNKLQQPSFKKCYTLASVSLQTKKEGYVMLTLVAIEPNLTTFLRLLQAYISNNGKICCYNNIYCVCITKSVTTVSLCIIIHACMHVDSVRICSKYTHICDKMVQIGIIINMYIFAINWYMFNKYII